ncbi:MAG TPA: hypothetical protein VM122_04290 [Usitatibacter sp.]|nr:hypothetical protein [Usitatibacter sp.]
MKNALAALLFLAPSLGLAADPPQAAMKGSWHPFTVTLAPTKDHEVCTRMQKGETRRYHWKSDAAVDFNIHHHKGNDVIYPVKRPAMRGDGGSFTAKDADEYCWMWTARAANAKVEGRLEDPPEATAKPKPMSTPTKR